MKDAYLIRLFQNEHQTLGSISVFTGNEIFLCKTLELSWLNNQTDVSSIPDGVYNCQWTRSPRFSKLAGHDVYTYEVMEVPARAGVRIHSANYYKQLNGCIALGSAIKDINADNELDVLHSGDTLKAFEEIMNKEPFRLFIASINE